MKNEPENNSTGADGTSLLLPIMAVGLVAGLARMVLRKRRDDRKSAARDDHRDSTQA